jgi:hypothetical protein
MARTDVLYLEDPCSGSRRMVDYLAREGIPISRDRVRNLMRWMGLWAIYQKPRTTVPGDLSERYPCLVDLNQVRGIDQVWATDITYIPLQKGFLHLVAIVDLFSRHILSWKLSNSLDIEVCLDALEMAWLVAISQRCSIRIRAVNSLQLHSWGVSKQKRSRSAGLAEGGVTTTSLSKDYGAHSNMRRCTCVPTAMVSKPRHAWPSSFGGIAM